MFMRRELKEGRMFQLANNNRQKSTQSEINTFGTVASSQIDEEQSMQGTSYQPPPFTNFKDFNVEQIAAQNNMAVIFCGAVMSCLCLIIGVSIFYFFLFDYVKLYIPFLQDPNKYLTQVNAKQYFAINPMYAGQFHYPRVPVEYWSHRIDMVKSMGLNTLSVYVFWNFHEISKGKFDFQTKNKNLTYFLQLCKQKNIQVLLRPGPYVCAQWDFGGLPTRFLNVEGMKIRSSNNLFIEQTKIYFQQLSKVIKNYILNKKNPSGPILMIQIQNQPAWYTEQALYITKLKQLWDSIGIDCPLYFDDTTNGLKNSTLYWENAIIGMNPSMYDKKDFDIFKDSNHFVFGGEVYTGWFMSWGKAESWRKDMIKKYNLNFTEQFSNLLADDRSFSMYMAHGGTNFGLIAGYDLITSYDYYSPINEQGRPAPNYHAFRSIIMNYQDKPLPKIPAPIQTMSFNFGKMIPMSSLFDNLPMKFQESKEPQIFESQNLKMYQQGIVLYETTLQGAKQYQFEVIIHDIAFVYVNGKYFKTILRKQDNGKQENQQLIISCKQKSCKLQILVEAMGHKNFGHQMNDDKKGIIKFSHKNKNLPFKHNWKHYTFDLSTVPEWKNVNKCTKAPCLYQIEVDIEDPKDTFINVKELKKGYVWVNGNNLGRYWDIGPQFSLYCPGVWFNKGKNRILILDLYLHDANFIIKGQENMIMEINL